jgi:hypothetical protein
LSPDGIVWLPGAGGYGRGWGDVGKGVSVETGATLYIRYYADGGENVSLRYAAHGADWGSWQTIGPALTRTVGNSATNPIILKLSDLGTPRSTITWVNGSGTWHGFNTLGAYDFALRADARWTLPPISITNGSSSSWWRALWRGMRSDANTAPASPNAAVPDSGASGVLLVIAVIGAAVAWRCVKSRRARTAKPAVDPKS